MSSSKSVPHRAVVLRNRWIATNSSEIPAWQKQSLGLWFGAWMALGAMLTVPPSLARSAPSFASGSGPSSQSARELCVGAATA